MFKRIREYINYIVGGSRVPVPIQLIWDWTTTDQPAIPIGISGRTYWPLNRQMWANIQDLGKWSGKKTEIEGIQIVRPNLK